MSVIVLRSAVASATLPATQSILPSQRWRLKLTKAITAFSEELAVRGRSAATIAAYESDLTRLKAMIPLDTVLHVTPEAMRHALAVFSSQGCALATLHRRLATFRTFGKWGVRRGLWTANPAGDLDSIRRPRTLPRPFTDDEVARLLALALPPREALIRSLLLYTGLRITPLCGIKIGDISLLPPTIRAMVKGAKVQIIKMHPRLVDEVKAYLREHTDGKGYSFLIAKDDGAKRPRMRDVQRLVAKWGERAQVPVCVPHRFRHSFATKLLRTTKNLRLVQAAMGHEDIKSTTIYTQITDADEAAAIGELTWELQAGVTRHPESPGTHAAQVGEN